MDRAQKRQLVSTLNEEWKDTGVMVIAHYKGMLDEAMVAVTAGKVSPICLRGRPASPTPRTRSPPPGSRSSTPRRTTSS